MVPHSPDFSPLLTPSNQPIHRSCGKHSGTAGIKQSSDSQGVQNLVRRQNTDVQSKHLNINLAVQHQEEWYVEWTTEKFPARLIHLSCLDSLHGGSRTQAARTEKGRQGHFRQGRARQEWRVCSGAGAGGQGAREPGSRQRNSRIGSGSRGAKGGLGSVWIVRYLPRLLQAPGRELWRS